MEIIKKPRKKYIRKDKGIPKLNFRKYPELWKKSGVYKIICKVTFRFLVGSSIDLSRRRIYHDCVLNKNQHPNPKLQEEYNLYGKENFDLEVLEFCEGLNEEEIKDREQYWLDTSKAVELGYNLQPSAKDNSGHKYSEKSKKLMSKIQQETKRTEEYRKKTSLIHKEVNKRPGVREKKRIHLQKLRSDPNYQIMYAENLAKLNSPENKAKTIERLIKQNKDPAFIEKCRLNREARKNNENPIS